jgi:toxin FitB
LRTTGTCRGGRAELKDYTNVVSELQKRELDPNVLGWHANVRSADLFLGVPTIGEVRLGIERLRRNDRTRAGTLELWLHGL